MGTRALIIERWCREKWQTLVKRNYAVNKEIAQHSLRAKPNTSIIACVIDALMSNNLSIKCMQPLYIMHIHIYLLVCL